MNLGVDWGSAPSVISLVPISSTQLMRESEFLEIYVIRLKRLLYPEGNSKLAVSARLSLVSRQTDP